MNQPIINQWFYDYKAKDKFEAYLDPYKGLPNLEFLEIGCWQGTSGKWTLENILTDPTSKLTCVDKWDIQDVEDVFDQQILQYNAQVNKQKRASFFWLLDNQDKQFDFIYIDGDHRAHAALLDFVCAFPLLKVNGIMAIDDYLIESFGYYDKEMLGVKKVADFFLKEYKDKIEILEISTQIWIKKISS
jgi:predicted O-methyltransferase YrrM